MKISRIFLKKFCEFPPWLLLFFVAFNTNQIIAVIFCRVVTTIRHTFPTDCVTLHRSVRHAWVRRTFTNKRLVATSYFTWHVEAIFNDAVFWILWNATCLVKMKKIWILLKILIILKICNMFCQICFKMSVNLLLVVLLSGNP